MYAPLKEKLDAHSPLWAVYQHKQKELADIKTRVCQEKAALTNLTDLQGYFAKLIDSRREGILNQVLSYASEGLQIIFDNPDIELLLEDTIKNGRKSTKIGVRFDGIETWDWNAASGGVRQATSFILRALFLSMSANRKFLVLDEPFSALSAKYRENMAKFIDKLSTDLGMQLLIVTHQPEITDAATTLLTIEKSGDSAVFRV